MANEADQWVFVSQPENTDKNASDMAWEFVKSADDMAGKDDEFGKTLASIGQSLKILAQRKGLIRVRLTTELVNELVVQLAAHIQGSDDSSVKSIGTRRLRELKQTLTAIL